MGNDPAGGEKGRMAEELREALAEYFAGLQQRVIDEVKDAGIEA